MCMKGVKNMIKKQEKRKMTFQTEPEVSMMSKVLKEKHYVNLSALFRDSVVLLYNKLEGIDKTDNK